MSFRLDWTLKIRADTDLSPSAKLVAYALATYMDGDGLCWPSIATLAAATSLSQKTVKRARDGLVASGWLAVVERGGGRDESGKRTSNRYRGVMATPLAELRGVRSDRQGGHRVRSGGSPLPPNLKRTRKRSARTRDGERDAVVASANGQLIDVECFHCSTRPAYEMSDGRLLCPRCVEETRRAAS